MYLKNTQRTVAFPLQQWLRERATMLRYTNTAYNANFVFIFSTRGVGNWLTSIKSKKNSLRGGRSGDRIPVGLRFFAAVQTGRGAHPVSYKMSTGFLSSSARVKERVKIYLCSPSGPSWPVLGRTLPLPKENKRHVIQFKFENHERDLNVSAVAPAIQNTWSVHVCPNVAVRWVAHLRRIPEVLGSNLYSEPDYVNLSFCCVSS
jgi:hypothetical protein